MARLPDIEGEQSKLTVILRAMGNAKRMRILNELSDGRERSVSELEGVITSLSQSALSQHLARLRRANIVKTRRESQTIYYSINDADVLRILRLLGHLGVARLPVLVELDKVDDRRQVALEALALRLDDVVQVEVVDARGAQQLLAAA